MWTPLESTFVTTKAKIQCRCQCGIEKLVRVREILDGKSTCCRSCACRIKNAKIPKERRVAIAKKASVAAVEALKKKEDPYFCKYGEQAVRQVLNQAVGAKQRCTNPNDLAYPNYGGRGIQFCFPSVRAYAEWVLDNIGARPSNQHSIDRIDNDRHYEPGNLRWATRAEQASNKRVYKRTKRGEAIRRIKQKRPDLTYETIRAWLVQGRTEEEILQRRKYDRSSI